MSAANRFADLHIPIAKTGAQQDVEITDDAVLWLTLIVTAAATPATDPRARLLPLHERRFRFLFAAAAAQIGLPPEVTPHSLRHGGATHDYVTHRLSVDQIRVRGRWRSERSMHHYVGCMRSALVSLRVPERAVREGAALVSGAGVFGSIVLAVSLAPATRDVIAFRAAFGRMFPNAPYGPSPAPQTAAQPPPRRRRKA